MTSRSPSLLTDEFFRKNKPNGQFKLDFEPHAIKAFMHDLSIRKVPGVGRVNERLLDSIGIKVRPVCPARRPRPC